MSGFTDLITGFTNNYFYKSYGANETQGIDGDDTDTGVNNGYIDYSFPDSFTNGSYLININAVCEPTSGTFAYNYSVFSLLAGTENIFAPSILTEFRNENCPYNIYLTNIIGDSGTVTGIRFNKLPYDEPNQKVTINIIQLCDFGSNASNT